jgi:hypothetical protein
VHVTRITPFDNFLYDLLAWLDTAWYVWIVAAALIAIVIASVAVSRVVERRRRRIPKYRRQLSS